MITGWLFSMIANSTKTMQETQAIASVRSAVNETRIYELEKDNDHLTQTVIRINDRSIENKMKINAGIKN